MQRSREWVIAVLISAACGPAVRPEQVETAEELSVNGGVNVARATKGAVAAASSEAPGAPVSSLINGDRRGLNWGDNGGWSDNTFQSHPDTVTITFPGPRLIDEINVFSLQDDFANPVEPIQHVTTFTMYGARNFSVAIWNGSKWVTVGLAIGNNYVWRKLVFTPVVTTKIRIHVSLGGTNGHTQLTEVEAWTAAPGGCASYCGGIAVRSCDATCTAENNIPSTCGQHAYTCVGGPALPSCSYACSQWSSCFDRCSNNGVESSCESFACDRPKLYGAISTTYGYDVNRCVDDPVDQVSRLPDIGVSESFHYPNDFPETSGWGDCTDLIDCGDHWQTIVRLPEDPSRFMVTLNQEEHPHYSGYLGLLGRSSDVAEMMQRVDSSNSSNRYNHPGGAQALGTRYLFVAEEQQDGIINARIRIYDQELLISGAYEGVNPVPFPLELPSHSTFELPSDIDHSKGAAAVAVAKLRPLPGESSGRYFMMVASQDYSFRIYYWLSGRGRPLSSPQWEKVGYLQLRTGGDTYIRGWGKQQNMNLLTDCTDGQLYLISWGKDGITRLHRVDFFLEHVGNDTQLSGSIGSGTVAEHDGNCGPSEDHCWFGAGAGSYVDAGGDLQVYGTSRYYTIRTAGYCNSTGGCEAE